MAITTTWTIDEMVRDTSTGGVTTVYWSCVSANDGTPSFTATEGGKLRLEPDADDSDFVAYDDLTEATVLGWVWDGLTESDETADEAKARVEANREAKVQKQIDRATAQSNGKPW